MALRSALAWSGSSRRMAWWYTARRIRFSYATFAWASRFPAVFTAIGRASRGVAFASSIAALRPGFAPNDRSPPRPGTRGFDSTPPRAPMNPVFSTPGGSGVSFRFAALRARRASGVMPPVARANELVLPTTLFASHAGRASSVSHFHAWV
jgi:hypothetical protein